MSEQKDSHTTDDQDAAALLMLFQQQSTTPASSLPSSIPTAQHPLPSSSELPVLQRETLVQQHLAPALVPTLASKEVGSLNKDISKSVTIPEPISNATTTQLQEPLETKRTSVTIHTDSDSFKKTSNTNTNLIQQRPNLSAHSSGSSASNHSRSNSGNNFSTSPGPAAAALARSTNNKNDPSPSNVKAMVAAAALAAALATPFPLVSYELRKELKVEQPSKLVKVKEPVSIEETGKDSVNEVPEVPSDSKETQVELAEKSAPESVKESNGTATTTTTTTTTPGPDPGLEDEPEVTVDEKKTKQEQEQPPSTQEESSYYADPDSGTIGCVCEYDHDDGFTIQCDRCYRWQHASCMGIKSMDEVPEFYLCYLCDKSRKVNKAKAREAQRDFLMPTSKRKRLNSMDSGALREEIVNQVTSLPGVEEDSKANATSSKPKDGSSSSNKDSATSVNSPVAKEAPSTTTSSTSTTRGRKQKPPAKKETPDAVDDTELFMNSKDGYKTVYFPLNKCEFKNDKTEHYFKKLADLLSSKQNQDSVITGITANELRRKLSRCKLSVKPFGENLKMRFSGFSRFSVIVENNVNEDDLVLEVIGEIELKQDYVDNPFNHYNIWGVAKPKVFFIPDIPFVVDSRYSGNEVRFIRRSCNPSCEIKTVMLKNENSIKFVVRALRPLKVGQEVTLPWEWEPSHPINKIIDGKSFDQLTDEEKPVLVRSVETVLNGCECACNNNNECYLYKVRKLLAYLYRSTRKVNIPTFGNNLTKYSDIYRQRDESYHVPIKKRLEERDKEIMLEAQKIKLKNNVPAEEEDQLESRLEDLDNSGTGSGLPDNQHHKREFVIKQHRGNSYTSVEPDLLPYKYRLLQSSNAAAAAAALRPQASAVVSQQNKIKEEQSSQELNLDDQQLTLNQYPIPIPILKPVVMNRVPSISGDSLSVKSSISSSIVTGSTETTGGVVKPPIKKKMSLKDYMKSKKK